MYNETRLFEDNKTITLQLPFNKNTTIAFCIGTPLVLGLIALLYFWRDIDVDTRAINYNNTIPITLLNFGQGDGTGMSKGNLAEEGIKHKGDEPESTLHDAEITAQTKVAKIDAETDPSVSNKIKSVSDISSSKTNNNSQKIGSTSTDVGLADGSIEGTGLGSRNMGMGMGEGFGDIAWGGGGNRIILSKKPPKFPKGVNTSGEIKIQFVVKPDGTVAAMHPLQKCDPALERAALEALKQWRFNAVKDTIDMIAIIPFRFKLK
jgi:TonB family protein